MKTTHPSEQYRKNWEEIFGNGKKQKQKINRTPVAYDPKQAFSQYRMRPEAREALFQAVDEDETVMELQPLIWGRLTYECGNANLANNVAMGVSEKIANILADAGVLYMLDLVEQSVISLKDKCDNLGAIGIDDIVWSVINFDRYDQYKDGFMKSIYCGLDPVEIAAVARRLQEPSPELSRQLFGGS